MIIFRDCILGSLRGLKESLETHVAIARASWDGGASDMGSYAIEELDRIIKMYEGEKT